ncbi:DUF2239 family protein [Brevundimonas mediterranea]|uniref:DUF2239 family protein n=1 Tax=Brevundimonas mediterranea TaxID=74329 RepID=A0A7W6A8F0_9CAUL|nr:DUF2239 family protein [Brevundimonas mediterranea]MBB3873615.1 hypothetical protein [Brevundimonas mediterranea]
MDDEIRELVLFDGPYRIAKGPEAVVVAAFKTALSASSRAASSQAALRVFDLRTGRAVDLDLRPAAPPPPKRGRPRLGVAAREVTLLPRHWDWLAAQPGGASAALRRLVDQARKTGADDDARRRRTDAAYGFMVEMAGDAPDFEEASRALFAGDRARLATLIAPWPTDIHAQILELFDGAASTK